MSIKYIQYGNKIELYIKSPNENGGFIKEDFDYKKKPFAITLGVNNLLKLETNIEVKQNLLYYKIIKELNDKTKTQDLDYLQKLDINGTRCWIIDNGSDICLMLPSEY